MYKIWLDKPISCRKVLLNESFVLVTRVKPFPASVWLISGSLMMKLSFVPILVITVVPLTRKLRLVAGDHIYNARWQSSILCLRLMHHIANCDDAVETSDLLHGFNLTYHPRHSCRKNDFRQGTFWVSPYMFYADDASSQKKKKKRPIIFLYDTGRFISLCCLRIGL